MERRYFKEYSHSLDRDMEFTVFGTAGKPCLVFPPQNGRFYDFENFHMIDACAEFIEDGRLQVFCADSIDSESWSGTGSGRARILQQEKWYRYITEELVPRILRLNYQDAGADHTGKLLVSGCSMGATHAANFFLRRPDLFDSLIALSGIYQASYFFGEYMDDLVYLNSPIDYLSNMPENHPYIALYNARNMIFCVGRGAWEEDLLASLCSLEQILQRKDIHAWVDYWGCDVSHDWCWWQKQLPYFLRSLTL